MALGLCMGLYDILFSSITTVALSSYSSVLLITGSRDTTLVLSAAKEDRQILHQRRPILVSLRLQPRTRYVVYNNTAKSFRLITPSLDPLAQLSPCLLVHSLL